MKDPGRIFIGLLLIAVGTIFLLKSLGIGNFPVWEGFKTYWPLGLVLVGVALMLRARAVAFLFLLLLVVMGVLYIGERNSTPLDNMQTRELQKDIAFDPNIKSVDLNLDYGAGDLLISEGTNEYLMTNKIRTSSKEDPVINVDKQGSNARIDISSRPEFSLGVQTKKNSMDIKLSPEIDYTINLDYGAAEADINIKSLKVKKLSLNTGATNTKITFGSYPVKTDIDTGASALILYFPKNAGISIAVDGLVSQDLKGFRKDGNTYYSDAYDPAKENMVININAGASSIRAEFY